MMSNTTARQQTPYTHSSIEEQRWMEEGGQGLDERQAVQATILDLDPALAPDACARRRGYRKGTAVREAYPRLRRLEEGCSLP